MAIDYSGWAQRFRIHDHGALDWSRLIRGAYEAERLPLDFTPEHAVPDFAYNVLNQSGLLYRPIVDEHHVAGGGGGGGA